MKIVKIKAKSQVTIPKHFLDELNLHVGDVLEAKINGSIIELRPKMMVDRTSVEDATIEPPVSARMLNTTS
jgi:AbrB family looped-hinge helix DNA binding protein